ncbi:GspH/FimT family pseudopilin [uncultured Halopseudomonas sp.]|uniref:GspH/FimT family pseudopilin n=1 Tax=uncultured Halopseudomonas sp. TaxID=2901193 RepID=UPI0030EF5BF8
MKSVKGFTLIELMIALAVLALVTLIGFPAFSGVFERSRADSDLSDLLRAFSLARLESINQSRDVKIVAGTDDDWTQDLVVFLDDDNDGSVDNGERVIRRYAGLPQGASITATGDVDTIVFDSLGGLKTPANSVVFNYTRGDSTKNLVICPTGRILTGASCI